MGNAGNSKTFAAKKEGQAKTSDSWKCCPCDRGALIAAEAWGAEAGAPPRRPDMLAEATFSGRPALRVGLKLEREFRCITYEDGSTYVGQIVEERRHGHGVWTSASGRYEGQWKDGEQHGVGRQSWLDGRAYQGHFVRGRFTGHGRMVWYNPEGELVYEGQYQDDLKHGVGKFSWPDGRKYEGEWRLGRRHGRAKYVVGDKPPRVGFWSDDKFQGWAPEDEGEVDFLGPSLIHAEL